MATKLDEIRQQYPAYKEVDDETLAQALYDKAGYAEQGKNFDDFKSRLGMETIGVGESALRGAGQGLTFGFSDEITAGLRTGLDSFAQGNIDNFGERYDTMLAEERATLERSRRENPWATGLGEVGGGLLTGGAGAARAVAGQTVGKGLARMGVAGAGIGGAAGYGYSEGDPLAALLQQGVDTPQGREAVSGELAQAGSDAATMAAVGGVAGPILSGATGVAKTVSQIVARPFTREARLNEAGRRMILTSLENDLKSGNMTLAQAQAELRNTPGMKVADLGKSLQRATEMLSQTPTRAAGDIEEQLLKRNAEQYDRIMPSVNKVVNNDGAPSQFYNVLDKLRRDASEQADQAFGAAYSRPVRVTRTMDRILKETPLGRFAIKEADKLAQAEFKKLPSIGKAGTMASTERTHLIMQGMRDYVGNMYKRRPAVAARYKERMNEFREEVFNQNPELRNAMGQWGEKKTLEEAMEMGTKIFSADAALTAQKLAGMGEGQQVFARVGMLKALEKKLGDRTDTGDISKVIMQSRNSRDIFRNMFPTDQEFNNFTKLLASEKNMYDTYYRAVGNSATARRLSGMSDSGEQLAGLLGYGLSLSSGAALPPSIGGYLARKGYGAVRGDAPEKALQTVAQKQGELLMGNNLSPITQPGNISGLLSPGLPVTPNRMIGGLLSTGAAQPGTNDQYGRPIAP